MYDNECYEPMIPMLYLIPTMTRLIMTDGIMEAEVPLDISNADTTPSAELDRVAGWGRTWLAELAGQKPGYNDTDSDRIGGYLF